MWCLWTCSGSPFSSRFSYCCKKRKKTCNLSETIHQSTEKKTTQNSSSN
jgi:hypothetical protein